MYGLFALLLGYGAYQTLFASKAVYDQYAELQEKGRYTVAKIIDVTPRRKGKTSLSFEYTYNGQKLYGTETVASLMAPSVGDKQYVAFLPDKPGITSLKGKITKEQTPPTDGWEKLPE